MSHVREGLTPSLVHVCGDGYMQLLRYILGSEGYDLLHVLIHIQFNHIFKSRRPLAAAPAAP